MPDHDAPRYRYWGSHKPAGMGVVAEKTGKTATMKIYDPIDDWGSPFGVSAKEFGAALDALDSDVETIELHVHSPGGIAWEGVAIMNLLRQHPAQVHAVVDGMAASAASYIVVGGADRVTMAPNATLMIHDASGLCYGQAADMKVMLDRLEMLSQNIAEVYAGKAGGSVDDWRAAMQPETWYTADEAVAAGLADAKLSKKAAPAAAPTDRFDLSIFAHAGREHAPAPFIPIARTACTCGPDGKPAVAGAQHRDECAHQTPAEPPEKHPHQKEDVTMTPDDIKALRERLGLAEDADLTAITAKLDELEEAATKPGDAPEITDEAVAKHLGLDPEQVKTAVDAAKNGKVAVSQSYLDALSEKAEAGVKALERQDREDRDATLAAAQTAGKIGRDAKTVASWQRDWERDPEATKAELDKLPARFPVGTPSGYAGSDGSDGDGVKPFTDDEADALAALTGTTKEALLNG